MLAAETKPRGIAVSASVPDAGQAWRKVITPVEPFLDLVSRRLADQVQTFDPEIVSYAHYALANQGKQLRPALVALSAGTIGPGGDALVNVAVIIEIIHLATLVHDDVMDEALLRRRRPTLAANYGNQVSVLLGDCLFAHALALAAEFPTTEVCRVVSAATKTVCSGEILQTHRRRKCPLSREEYFKILEMKTAELFAVSCHLGSWVVGADARERAALRTFGLKLGTAYQVYDDCLDIFGSEASVGKTLGTDLANGKVTLPVLVALERASVADRGRLQKLIAHWDPREPARVLDLLDHYQALGECRGVIHGFLEGARRALLSLPESTSRTALTELTGFLAQQTDALGFK
jgi:octaprenyl-diphosphate synthase